MPLLWIALGLGVIVLYERRKAPPSLTGPASPNPATPKAGSAFFPAGRSPAAPNLPGGISAPVRAWNLLTAMGLTPSINDLPSMMQMQVKQALASATDPGVVDALAEFLRDHGYDEAMQEVEAGAAMLRHHLGLPPKGTDWLFPVDES